MASPSEVMSTSPRREDRKRDSMLTVEIPVHIPHTDSLPTYSQTIVTNVTTQSEPRLSGPTVSTSSAHSREQGRIFDESEAVYALRSRDIFAHRVPTNSVRPPPPGFDPRFDPRYGGPASYGTPRFESPPFSRRPPGFSPLVADGELREPRRVRKVSNPLDDLQGARDLQEAMLKEHYSRLEEMRMRSQIEDRREEQRAHREWAKEKMRLDAEERERVYEERRVEREREAEKERREEAELRERERREADERREAREMEKIRLQHELELARLQAGQVSGTGTTVPHYDKSVKLQDFDDEKGDMSAYLKQFERVANWLKWPKETWAMRLSVRLKGTARTVVDNMSDADVNNYDLLSKELLRSYQLTAAGYLKDFHECRKGNSETFTQMLARMEMYFRRWLEMEEIPETFEALKNILLINQLYESCSPKMMSHIRLEKPKDARDAADKAENYLSVQRDQRLKNSTSQNGNEKDKKKKKKPNESETEEKTGKRTETRTCHHCQRVGHLKRNCPDRDKPAVRINLTLSPSKTATPLSYNPRVEGELNGTKTTVLRDTGAEFPLVDASLVPGDDPVKREVLIIGVHGAGRTYPVHLVQVDTPFWSGKIEAAAMHDLNVDAGLVLGNTVTDEKGKSHAVSVLRSEPLFSTAAVTTRSQSQKEREGATPLQVRDAGLERVDLCREQKDDPSLERFFRLAAAGDTAKSGKHGTVRFSVQNGCLRREYRGKDGEFKQIVVPKKLREKVMALAHDTPMAGHLGARKTQDRIWRHFYWPGMSEEIRRWCASCERCQKTTQKGRVKKVPLGEMPLVEEPFRRVAADLIGPISPPSDRKHRFILVVVDYATRYPEATPLKNIDAESVAEALWTMWTRVGVPTEILTDNGSQFVGGIMTEVNRLLAMKGLRCAPFHAQCNGLCERFNGTLKQMLRRLCGDKPKDWDRYIPALLFAYREVPQESLGYSPFELLYGRSVRGPIQILKELWTNQAMPEEVRTPSEYVVNLRERIADVCELAQANLDVARKRHARAFNRKTKHRSFEVGSRVLLLLPTKHNKLEMEWRGPFDVLERVGDWDYRLDIHGKARLYHANMLKEFLERREPDPPRRPTARNSSPQLTVYRAEQGTVSEEPSQTCSTAVATVIDAEDANAVDEIPVVSARREEGPEDVHIDEDLPGEEKETLAKLCQRFDSTLTDLPGRTELVEFTIETEDERPVFVRPYPLPYAKAQVVKDEVESMLKLGVIERAASPYNSPIVLVRKPDGKVRFCSDFREINRKVIFDGEPLPDPEMLFARVSSAKFFSKVDLSKGYWQLFIRKKDRPKTAFSTPGGQFQWVVMPFGISTAVAVFSRMMRLLLEPLQREDIHNFMDDCLVATATWGQHLEALEALFRRLQETGLTARPSKCYLAYRELDFLGHRVGHGCVWPEPSKVEKIRNARRPETKKELRSALGLFGYYRKFIPSYASIALCLTDKTRKGTPEKLDWDEDCERAFQTLKERLCCEPILKLPDVAKIFTLRTDASAHSVGATLMQEYDGTLFPCSYASKKLLPAETRYSTVERECLGIVWGIRKFQTYLYGQKFWLGTDQSSLQYLKKAKHDNARLMRWALFLQSFTFVVKAIPGKENVVADFLSRFAEDRNVIST